MPGLEHFCHMELTFEMKIIGAVPSGLRADAYFQGAASGPHWEGEIPVEGVDYVTIRSDGNLNLDLRATMGSGEDMIAYRGTGVSISTGENSAEPRELITFETASEKFAWLNREIAVGLGRNEGPDLVIDFYLVRP